jgi:hypothetical protein
MKITLSTYRYGGYLLTATDGQTLLIQSDWDFPPLAQQFGWQSARTFGDDMEMISASITSAAEFLDECDGESIDDPGYF